MAAAILCNYVSEYQPSTCSCCKPPELPHYAPLCGIGAKSAPLAGVPVVWLCPARMLRTFVSLVLLGLCGLSSGCAFGRPAVAGNPIFIPAGNEDAIWERTVDVVHDY